MKTKKIVVLIVATVLVLSMVVMLAACNGGKSFDIELDNYLLDVQNIGGSSLQSYPTVTKINLDSSYTVSTTYAQQGLLVLQGSNSYKSGYLIADGTQFGLSEELTSLSAKSCFLSGSVEINVYVGQDRNDNVLLFDCKGDKKLEGANLDVNNSLTTVNEQTYLTVTGTEKVTYFAVKDDGSLGNALDEAPQEGNYPKKGESMALATVSLAEYMEVEDMYASQIEAKRIDNFVDETTVAECGNIAIFYDKDGDELSTWQIPDNILSKVYVDGKIIYSVKTPIDSAANDGFNFVDETGKKYNCTTYSFDIDSGKVTKLNVDYVVAEYEFNLFNKVDEKFDIVAVSVYKQIDGVAWASESACVDQIVINGNGEIGYSVKEHGFIPIGKAGENHYVASSLSSYRTVLLLDAELNVIASVSNPLQYLSDGIVVKINDRLGIVDYDGKVTFGFDYTYGNSSFGKYYVVTDSEGTTRILDASKKTARTLTDILNAAEEDISIRRYLLVKQDNNTGLYTYYDFDGKVVCSDVTSSYFSYASFTVNGQKFEFSQFTCRVNSQTETVYVRFAF